MKGIQLYHFYNNYISDVVTCCTTASSKYPDKEDDRCSRDDGVRAGRGSPCAILLL